MRNIYNNNFIWKSGTVETLLTETKGAEGVKDNQNFG